MKISVILSNYNGEKFLEEAICSVLDQDHRDYEFIIVDDGSSDGSPEIIRRYAADYPERVISLLEPENRGQGAGFNQAISRASGEIVAFIDSDDIWMPCKLSKLEEFVRLAGPAALYQHNLFLMEGQVVTERLYRPLLCSGDLYGEACATRRVPAHFVPTSGLAFPRTILEKVLPIPNAFRTCADGYLTRTSFCHGPVASCTSAWGYYRIHESNSVFNNPAHDNSAYVRRLLVPALNQYYGTIGVSLRFPLLDSRFGGDLPWLLVHVSLYDIYSAVMKGLKKRIFREDAKTRS